MKCLLMFILFFLELSYSQIPDVNYDHKIENELYVVDTLIIKDPIMIKFRENQKTDSSAVQSILVSKSCLDSVYKNYKMSYRDFLFSKNAYLFFTANSFSCLISNLIHTSPVLKGSCYYVKLQNNIRNAEQDTVWVKFDKTNDKPKKYKGWEYNEIFPRKFLLCLVKGSAILNCQSIDEIHIKNQDNIYFKVLVPITW